jgi:protein-tyrosine-phosphatase
VLRPGRRGRSASLLQLSTTMLRLLFVCVENSNRSQMAEAFARHLGGAGVEACSAGSRPSGTINPRAIAFMRERGIDLTMQHSKSLDAVASAPFDAVVTMGCGDACPWLPAVRREDWALPDPKLLDDAGFRRVRDEIEQRVGALLGRLGVAAGVTA